MYLFDRIGEIIIGKPGTPGRKYSGLNFSFSFKKTITPEMNPGTLKIFNLAASTRGSIHELESVCIVRVGYAEAEGPVEVFRGYVSSASTAREGPNLVTVLELRDGYQELQAAKANVSFSGGISLDKPINDIIKKLGFLPEKKLNRLKGKVAEVKNKILPRGWSFNGSAKDAMNELCSFAGIEWSIQSGQLKLLAPKEVDSTIVYISSESGLVGKPTRLSNIATSSTDAKDTKKKKQLGWRIESLLLPTVEPGNAVQVASEEVNGTFKVVTVSHEGELMGPGWNTTLEVVEV